MVKTLLGRIPLFGTTEIIGNAERRCGRYHYLHEQFNGSLLSRCDAPDSARRVDYLADALRRRRTAISGASQIQVNRIFMDMAISLNVPRTNPGASTPTSG